MTTSPPAIALCIALVLLTSAPAPARAAVPTRLAVLDVRVGGHVDARSVDGLSSLIASEVATRDPAMQVISSGDVRAMVGFEKQKELLGCEETSCLAEIGGALGVELLVVPEVSRIGDVWLLSMALVDIRKGRTVARLTRKAPTPRALLDVTSSAVPALLGPREAIAGVEVEPRRGPGAPTWVLLAGGVIAAAAGSVLLAQSYATADELESGSRRSGPTLTGARIEELQSSGRFESRLGVGLIAGGGAMALASWLVTLPLGAR